MSPRIVFHIGLHKTATTTLQQQYFPICNGLNLLTTAKPGVIEFVRLIRSKDPLYFNPADAQSLIEGLLSDHKVNLLSDESLSDSPFAGIFAAGLDHRSPMLENLRRVFPQAHIILVLRRQDNLSRSLYRQYLKRGGTAKIHRFFGLDDSERPALMSVDRFFFLPYLRYVFDHFPKVLVLPFEQFLKDQQIFLKRLCQFLEIKHPEVQLHPVNATRLGYKGMEMTRLLNHMLQSSMNSGPIPGIPRRRNGKWKQVSIMQYIHEYWPGRPSFQKNSPLTEVANEIRSMTREDNRAVDREYSLGLKEYLYY